MPEEMLFMDVGQARQQILSHIEAVEPEPVPLLDDTKAYADRVRFVRAIVAQDVRATGPPASPAPRARASSHRWCAPYGLRSASSFASSQVPPRPPDSLSRRSDSMCIERSMASHMS